MATGTYLKFVVYVPLSHADIIRDTLGEAGAGKLGNYSHCTFSVRGTGRFKGNLHSNPAIGQPGVLETVEEERIEAIIPRARMKAIVAAVKAVHPYEEMAFDLIPLEDI